LKFWRIGRLRYVAGAATGEGARLYGGRWNSRGISVVYSSTSLALAAIETFVNLEPNLQPTDLVSIEGEIPDALEVARLEVKILPRDWPQVRNESLRHFGDDWIRTGKTVALLVPSAPIRGEWNLLLNPAHSDFRKLKLAEPEAFTFDTRRFSRD